jgi:hypothetical protein
MIGITFINRVIVIVGVIIVVGEIFLGPILKELLKNRLKKINLNN